jgi:CBS domain-containing protein
MDHQMTALRSDIFFAFSKLCWRPTMKTTTAAKIRAPLMLHASAAEEVMSRNPLSIREEATVHEAIAFLTDRRISAAPVINEAGRPVGVISEADILRYDLEHVERLHPVPDYYLKSELTLPTGERLPSDFQVEVGDDTRVAAIMTPIIHAVMPDTPVADVVDQLVERKIHRLFVVDHDGSLIGVITTLDLLRRLRAS